jgi:hypothetical protein
LNESVDPEKLKPPPLSLFVCTLEGKIPPDLPLQKGGGTTA